MTRWICPHGKAVVPADYVWFYNEDHYGCRVCLHPGMKELYLYSDCSGVLDGFLPFEVKERNQSLTASPVFGPMLRKERKRRESRRRKLSVGAAEKVWLEL